MSSAFERLQKLAEEKKLKEKPKLELVESIDDKPTPPTPPTTHTPPTPSTLKSVSPEKDYTKVANSIVRDALSSKVFIGKSKQVYDFLYSQTRGAITPKRTIQIIKVNLMRGSGIGSERTLLKNLAHLKSAGLIKITGCDGQHTGNEYETFLPEEIYSNPPHARHARHAHHALQKVGGVPSPESGVGGVGLLAENKDTYSDPKTSFKDIEENDDEAFAEMSEILKRGSEKVSGKSPAKEQKENWKDLAELLVMELEIAAARTQSISNVPAFLTEHLRRRLLRKPENTSEKKVSDKKRISKSLQIGKPFEQHEVETQTYQAEPLSEKGRETVLKTLREYFEKGQEEFVMSLQDTYTTEDWQWLLEQLPISENKEKENIEKAANQ